MGRGVYVAGPGVSGSELGCFFVVTVHSLVFCLCALLLQEPRRTLGCPSLHSYTSLDSEALIYIRTPYSGMLTHVRLLRMYVCMYVCMYACMHAYMYAGRVTYIHM